MKKFYIALVVCLFIGAFWLFAASEDKSAFTIRYRNGTVLKFDTTTSIQDEDGTWTNTWKTLSRLRYLGTATANTPLKLDSNGYLTNGWVIPTNQTLQGATLSGNTTNSGLTASLSVFTDANKVLVSKSAADARTALEVLAKTNDTAYGLTLSGNTTNAGLTASLPVFTDANKVLASKTIANTLLALGIQTGFATNSADKTVTNTFPTAFSAAPIVVVSGTHTNDMVYSTNATTTNVVIGGDVAGSIVSWIAIGAP